MNLEMALTRHLETVTGLSAFWMVRPESATACVVFRALSVGVIEGNLTRPGIKDDSISLTVYHTDPDAGKAAADALVKGLHGFTGDLAGYPVQECTFTAGRDQPLTDAGTRTLYQFNRDFIFNH